MFWPTHAFIMALAKFAPQRRPSHRPCLGGHPARDENLRVAWSVLEGQGTETCGSSHRGSALPQLAPQRASESFQLGLSRRPPARGSSDRQQRLDPLIFWAAARLRVASVVALSYVTYVTGSHSRCQAAAAPPRPSPFLMPLLALLQDPESTKGPSAMPSAMHASCSVTTLSPEGPPLPSPLLSALPVFSSSF